MEDRYECIKTFFTSQFSGWLIGTEITEKTYNSLPDEHKKNFVRFKYTKKYYDGYSPLTNDILNFISKKDD